MMESSENKYRRLEDLIDEAFGEAPAKALSNEIYFPGT